MRRACFIAILSLLSFTQVFAQSAKDEQHFKAAQSALKEKKCDVALRELQQVSIDGKDDIRYVELMGEMHECKGNKDEAVFFYRKYMAARPNDTTQFKINYLESDIAKNGGSNDTRNINYKSTNRNYKLLNLAGTAITGKRNECNYNSGFKMTLTRGRPAFHHHAVLEFGVDLGILVSPNKEWYANALYTYPEKIHRIGAAFNPGLNIALMPVVYKNKKLSVAVGPTAGFTMLATLGHSYSSFGGSVNDDNFFWSSPILGVRSRVYYKHIFTAFAEYNKLTRSKLSVNSDYNEYFDMPIKMSMISIGVGIYTSFNE